MIEYALLVIIIIQLSFLLWSNYRPSPTIDIDQMGAAIAVRLMDLYERETDELAEHIVKNYSRERFLEIAAATGLPLAFADPVAVATWRYVEKTLETDEPIYE